MVFEKSSEYLCYVEAVHKLYHEREVVECDFLQRKDEDFFPKIVDHKKFVNEKFLHKGDRTKEYFFILDNTEWSEAVELGQQNWKGPMRYHSKDDVVVKVTTEMNFTSNDKYEAWS